MKLYLVRHAIATPRTYPPIGPDADRPLTGKGRRRMALHAQALVVLGEHIDLVVTSPYVRARETAEILADAFRVKPPIELDNGMAPGGNYMKMLHALAQRCAGQAVALVGHEPDMSEMAETLLGRSSDIDIEFKKGAVCRIDLRDGAETLDGEFRWLRSPKELRAIAKGK